MSRSLLYIASLCALLAFPVLLFYEFNNNYSYLSGPVIRAIVAASKFIFADVAFVSEITPAAIAVGVAALAPRPLPYWLNVSSLIACAVGYSSYVLVSIHVSGETILLDHSMLNWIESAIEGHVPRDEFDQAIESIQSICSSVRVYYLMIFASVVGFAINKSGEGNTA